MPPKRKTRNSCNNCFGPSAELPDDGNLFTLRDVLAACEIEHERSPTCSNSQIADRIIPKLTAKWKQSNPELVLIAHNSIEIKIVRAISTANDIRLKKLSKKQSDTFLEKLDKLFDLLVCKCPIEVCPGDTCTLKSCPGLHADCSCNREDKIPPIELAFVRDQRKKVGHIGDMQMGLPDRVESKRQEANNKKKASLDNYYRLEKEILQDTTNKKRRILVEDDEGDVVEADPQVGVDECVADKDYDIGATLSDHNQNRVNIMPFIAEVERYFISDRAASALYNAALKTVGMITAEDNQNVVDKCKIARGRASYRAEVSNKKREAIKDLGGIGCVGVDGKRDRKSKKIVVEVINGTEVEKKKVGVEEHITYTVEPSGDYLTHSTIAPGKGTGRDLADDFLDVLADHECTESIEAVVMDGTNTNTGWKDGLVAHVERDLPAVLLWLVCQLHGNELPFRHLFSHCDGGLGTSGPDSFKGPLGKQCKEEVHLLNVIKFETINTCLDDLDVTIWSDLSRDQKLLYQYVKAIQTGEVSDRLAMQVVGPIDHSRWLTLSIRILQIYTRTAAPSLGLRMIATYICQVYAPMWFLIKAHSKFTQGPMHILKLIELVRDQPEEVQVIVKPAIQRNAYFAEPGIMLTSMLEDQDANIRKSGIKIIKKLRSNPPKPPKSKILKGVRKHEIPQLNWNASKWTEIIDLERVKIWEPKIISKLSLEKVEAACESPISFPKYPCHSQTVERMVKLVTEVSGEVYGEKKQREKAVAVLASRRSRKAYESKKDYKVD